MCGLWGRTNAGAGGGAARNAGPLPDARIIKRRKRLSAKLRASSGGCKASEWLVVGSQSSRCFGRPRSYRRWEDAAGCRTFPPHFVRQPRTPRRRKRRAPRDTRGRPSFGLIATGSDPAVRTPRPDPRSRAGGCAFPPPRRRCSRGWPRTSFPSLRSRSGDRGRL